MAALSQTKVGFRTPVGSYVEQTFKVTTGAGAADEWIATGFKKIIAVVGVAIIGTAGAAATMVFQKNARGTGVSEDTNPGDLGIENASAVAVEVTVRALL